MPQVTAGAIESFPLARALRLNGPGLKQAKIDSLGAATRRGAEPVSDHFACDKHLHASGLDFVDMHKNIGAAIIGRDKPISAIRVEEFDASSWHAVNPIHRAGILVPQILGWGEACRPNLVTLESSLIARSWPIAMASTFPQRRNAARRQALIP